MSKNIVMQELTASGYEELYPKTNTQEIVSSNATINQFLGGGDSLEDALGYLAGLNQHWWLKKSEENVYGVTQTKITTTITSSSLAYGKFGTESRPTTLPQTVKVEWSNSLKATANGLEMVNSNVGTFQFRDCWSVNDDDGYESYYFYPDALQWPLTSDGDGLANEPLKNKYVRYNDGDIYIAPKGNSIEYITDNSRGSSTNTNIFLRCRTYTSTSTEYPTYKCSSTLLGTSSVYSYVSSANPLAFPDNGATQDGAQYWYIGHPFENVSRFGKVELRRYYGTRSGVPSVTFEGTPMFFATYDNTSTNSYTTFYIRDSVKDPAFLTSGGGYNKGSPVLSGKTLTFGTQSTTNAANVLYTWFAITQ